MDATIKHFLTRDMTLLRTDQHLLDWDLSKLLLQSRANKQRWLYRVKQARARVLKADTKQSVLTIHNFTIPKRTTKRKTRPKHKKPQRHFYQQRLSNFTKTPHSAPNQQPRPRKPPRPTSSTRLQHRTAHHNLFQPTLHFFAQRSSTPPTIFDPPD